MLKINISLEENVDLKTFETMFSRQIKFVFFLPFQIFAIPTSLFIVYQLLKKRIYRKSLPNHVLVALNIVSLLDMILQQSGLIIFFQLNHVWPMSYAYCIIWSYLDYLNYALCLFLTCWALLERQIFSFNHNFYVERRKRLIIHFLPLFTIILYCVFFYIGLIILNPCQNYFDYTDSWCGDLCFLENESLYLFDWIINSLLPYFLIILISIILLTRVIRPKSRVCIPFLWRKHRKFAIQLLCISSLYTICFFPTIFTALVQKMISDSNFGIEFQTLYLDYMPVWARTITPFLSLAILPELLKQIKTFFTCCQFRRVNVVFPTYS